MALFQEMVSSDVVHVELIEAIEPLLSSAFPVLRSRLVELLEQSLVLSESKQYISLSSLLNSVNWYLYFNN